MGESSKQAPPCSPLATLSQLQTGWPRMVGIVGSIPKHAKLRFSCRLTGPSSCICQERPVLVEANCRVSTDSVPMDGHGDMVAPHPI